MPESLTIETVLNQIWSQFNANLGTLWVFNQQIGKLADEQDEIAFADLAYKVSQVFGEGFSEAEAILKEYSSENDDVEYTPKDIAKLVNELEDLNSDDFKKKITAWSSENPDKSHALAGLLREVFRQPPAHGKILRRSALITLVGFFELLETALLHAFYLYVSKSLPEKPEKMLISVEDLRDLDSLDDVEKHFIRKEVDGVIHESLSKRLKYFKDRLGIEIKLLEDLRDELIELFQRRNLFVHNNGVVNPVYLKHVPEKYLQSKQIKKDYILQVSPRYLSRAMETVHLFGFILIQLCWRNWSKKSHEAADRMFVDFTFDTLIQERFEFTRRIAYFASVMRIAKTSRRIIILNEAIALRELGERGKVITLLKECEWTPMSIDIQIAIYTLREEYDRVYSLLKQAAISGDIKRMSKQWPLFRPIAHEPRFIQVFEQGRPMTDN